MQQPRGLLAIIVISQFCCTSLWFAGNGVMSDLALNFNLPESALGHLTSAVQLGFILGTLCFAALTITDRFSPSRVFWVSAMLGAILNAAAVWPSHTFFTLWAIRFGTGFFLAGIYPVGMKIAADYYQKDLGKSLGFLVGALVLGTAFPHLLKFMSYALDWKFVMLSTSTLAIVGGFLILFLVPDGPYRQPGQKVYLGAFFKVFKSSSFRSAAFGYFGHMWELYAFWTFIPIILLTYQNVHPEANFNISLWCFYIIGIGSIACVIGGFLAQFSGTKTIAFWALLLSCTCCIFSSWAFSTLSPSAFLTFLLFWGMVVIADSPLFSTMVAHNANPTIKGTALTIVNSIGFATTVVSIQLINYLKTNIDPTSLFIVLAIGPLLGLSALYGPKFGHKD